MSAELALQNKLQADELRVLNGVIGRRKKSYRELRDRLDEAKGYHLMVPDGTTTGECATCGTIWPCPTYIALQPSVLSHGPSMHGALEAEATELSKEE